jgi:hypothetical protein
LHKLGDSFDPWAASDQLERARALGAQVIRLRRLHDVTTQKIDGQSTVGA